MDEDGIPWNGVHTEANDLASPEMVGPPQGAGTPNVITGSSGFKASQSPAGPAGSAGGPHWATRGGIS